MDVAISATADAASLGSQGPTFRQIQGVARSDHVFWMTAAMLYGLRKNRELSMPAGFSSVKPVA
jgi:hypothetical protein